MVSGTLNAVGVWFYCTSTNRHLYLMRNDKKYNGCWGLPGGKVEPGETLLAALTRECSEEIGAMPEYTRLSPIEKFTAESGKFIFHTFFCVVEHEFTPILNHEHIGYAWIDASVTPSPLHPGLWSTMKVDNFVVRTNALRSSALCLQ